jgi:hypothetical protein
MKLQRFLPALCLLPALAHAQYRIDFLGSGFVDGYITGLNNNGVVIGSKYIGASRQFEPFYGSATSGITPLPEFKTVDAINDLGVIAGTKAGNARSLVAVTYHNGQASTLNTSGYLLTKISGINNHGTVTGSGWNSDNRYRGLILQGGQVTEISAASSPHTATWTTDINDAGAVTGGHHTLPAFVHQNGASTYFPVAGSFGGEAIAINASGDVAGHFSVNMGSRQAFLYSRGVLHDISQAQGAGPGMFSVAGISDSGAVVGYGEVYGIGGASGAYLYANGKLTWLNQLVGDSKWHVGGAFAINDQDQIAAAMCLSSGSCQFALLTPVPEPATYGMLLAGLGIVGVALGRRRQPA